MVLTYNRVNSNKETFNIESKNNNHNKLDNLDTISFFVLTLFVVYYTVIYIKIIIAAFCCSKNEGIFAIFFSSMWCSWKFITLVNNYCIRQ